MENAVDEAMVPFKGRSSLKQYVPLKPVWRGFKIWVRADSVNGYVCDFSVYTGREEEVERDLGAKVVKRLVKGLVQPLAGCNYHVYFDNYFSTVRHSEVVRRPFGEWSICLRHLSERQERSSANDKEHKTG